MDAYAGTHARGFRKGGMRLALLFTMTTALVVGALAPSLALAEEEVTNDEILQVASLDGTATVENLPEGQISITVSSTNNTETKLTGHLVEFEAPEGYELVSGSLKSGIQSTDPSATNSTTAVFQKTGDASKKDGDDDKDGKTDGGADSKTSGDKTDNGSGNKGSDSKGAGKKGSLPSTGETLAYAGIAVVCACAGVLFIVAAKKLRFKGMVLIVATVALVAASYPVPMLQAFADEAGTGNTVEYEVQSDAGEDEGGADTAEGEAACDTPIVGTKTLDLSAGDQSVSVKAKVTFMVEGEHESATTVNVDTSGYIASDAKSAWIVLESTVPFAGTDTESTNEDEATEFDVSKLAFSGALEGATVRGGQAFAIKNTDNDEYAQNTIEGDDKTHYELTLQLDDINTEAAGESGDDAEATAYGYINFAEGSFAKDKDSDTDENSLGIACVAFKDPDVTIPQLDSTERIGSDSTSHTLDSDGNYWEQVSDAQNGTSTVTRFNIPFDFDGSLYLSQVRDDMPGYDQLDGDELSVGNDTTHKYKTLIGDNVTKNIALVDTCGADIKIASVDDSDYNFWITFEVNEADPQKAYDQMTTALSNGVHFNGILMGGASDVVAYPVDMEEEDAAEDAFGFTYAESNPTALVWASEFEEGPSTTEITYLCSLQSASDLIDDDEGLADVNLKNKTTFSATMPDVASGTEEASADDVSLSQTSGAAIESVKVADTGDDVAELKITVPTDEFISSLETLGLEDDASDETFASLYSYVSGIDLKMSDGSTNAFGLSETDNEVELIDGASLVGDLLDSEIDAQDGDESDKTEKTSTPTTTAEARSATDDLKKVINEIANDKMKSIVKTAAESGKKVFESIQNIIKAYNESGGATLSMLGPVGSIIGAAVTFINAFNFEEETTVTYSVNDVMKKLNELESKVDGIAANTSIITLSMQEMDSSVAYSSFASRLGSLHSYMSGNQMTALVSKLQEDLAKYKDTTDAHNTCTLATPLESMPDEAVTLVRKFVALGNKYAKLQTGQENAEAALGELYNMISGGGIAHNKTLLDAYFDYTENFYNWESETYTVRLAFIATISQMWLNAYMVANADVALQAYDLDKTGSKDDPTYDLEQLDKVQTSNKLKDQTSQVMKALYGDYNWDQLAQEYPNTNADSKVKTAYDLSKVKDGQYKEEYEANLKEFKEAGDSEADAAAKAVQGVLDNHYFTESTALQRTHDDGSGRERLLVVDASTVDPVYFSKTYTDDSGNTQSYYAKVSAYDKTCFGDSYVATTAGTTSSDNIMERCENSSWSANSSFKPWQIQQMVKRLDALPDALRPAITTTNSSGKEVRKSVENIDEELQALGFKSINSSPSTNYKTKLVGIDKNNASNYTLEEALKRRGVVDAGTAENPTPTEKEVALDRNADENQNWSFVLSYAGFNYTGTNVNNGVPHGIIRKNYWVELGGSSERLLGTDIGERIQNSGDWVITQSGGVQTGARNKFAHWHSKCRYGTVVNYKTGAVKENQLLYNFDTEFYESLTRWYHADGGWTWLTRIWNRISLCQWINRVEFYGFGVFDLTSKSGKIYTAEGTDSTYNLYYDAERSYYIPLAIQANAVHRLEGENSYWTVDSDGRLYATVDGVTDKTSRTDPLGVYSYKSK